MTTLAEELKTHLDPLRKALEFCAAYNTGSQEDDTYYRHEMKALDHIKSLVEQELQKAPAIRVSDLPQWVEEAADLGAFMTNTRVVPVAVLKQHLFLTPSISIKCVTGPISPEFPSSGGSCSLNVIRVEANDDGSFTAVTDYWPRDDLDARLIANLTVALDELVGECNGIDVPKAPTARGLLRAVAALPRGAKNRPK